MKNVYKFTLLLLPLFFTLLSCTDQNSSKEALVPDLLVRSESMQYGKEWDETMNNYQKYKLTIEGTPHIERFFGR